MTGWIDGGAGNYTKNDLAGISIGFASTVVLSL
jgi:hypothetical protein